MPAEGGEAGQLTREGGYLGLESWDPDEEWIVFGGAPQGSSELILAEHFR
jgi:Tol biopolymer transport system component